MAKLNDTTLVAYVDGELEPSASHEVATALEADPEARARVCALRRAAVLVRTVFNQPQDRVADAKLLASLGRRPRDRYRQPALAIAASVMIAAVGFGAGVLVGGRHVPAESSFATHLFDEVADYHALYAREDEHQVEIDADHRDQIEAWLGSRLHRHLHIPDLADRNLTFVGARLLAIDGSPVAELVYHWPDQPHKPLALCITFGDPGEQPVQADTRDGLQQVLWRHRGYSYLLVGWSPQPVLSSIAAELMPKLEKDYL